MTNLEQGNSTIHYHYHYHYNMDNPSISTPYLYNNWSISNEEYIETKLENGWVKIVFTKPPFSKYNPTNNSQYQEYFYHESWLNNTGDIKPLDSFTFANKAYQLRGYQIDYDRVMSVCVCDRQKEFDIICKELTPKKPSKNKKRNKKRSKKKNKFTTSDILSPIITSNVSHVKSEPMDNHVSLSTRLDTIKESDNDVQCISPNKPTPDICVVSDLSPTSTTSWENIKEYEINESISALDQIRGAYLKLEENVSVKIEEKQKGMRLFSKYKKDEYIEIIWDGFWYLGQIGEMDSGDLTYHVEYSEFDDHGNKTLEIEKGVPDEDLRQLSKYYSNTLIEIRYKDRWYPARIHNFNEETDQVDIKYVEGNQGIEFDVDPHRIRYLGVKI